MPPVKRDATEDWKEKAVREGLKRLLYRLPNGKMYHRVVEGIVDYAKKNPEKVKNITEEAKSIAVKVRDDISGRTAEQNITLEGMLALVDETPETGDLVVMTQDAGSETLATRGSYGVVKEIDQNSGNAVIEFSHLEGYSMEEETETSITYREVPIITFKKAILLEEGGRRSEVMWSTQRNRNAASILHGNNAKYGRGKEEKGTLRRFYDYTIHGLRELARIHRDHAIYLISTAIVMYAFDCGPFNKNTEKHGVATKLQHKAVQCSPLPPTLATGIYATTQKTDSEEEKEREDAGERSLIRILFGK
ncbi:hypothetical protein HY483_03935 [Candidatus Woesearchaeota archaeon]|nr:hypothetical protein [Candidatus Woesearchaeota archaeon]